MLPHCIWFCIYTAEVPLAHAGVAGTPLFATSTPLPGPGTEPQLATPAYQQPSNINKTPVSSRESSLLSHHLTPATIVSQKPMVDDILNPAFEGDNFMIGSRNGTNRSRMNRNAVISDPRLGKTEDFTLASSFEVPEQQPAHSIKLYELGILPCLLALFVCFFIYIDLGEVVFNSIVVPFILFEGQQFLWRRWQSSHGDVSAARGRGGGMLGTALLLCGVPQQLVSRYLSLGAAVKILGADFAVYLVTIVIWHSTIGLPQQNHDDMTHEFLESHVSSADDVQILSDP